MDTQHTSFIQPLFLISHYQILLNSIQPFKTVRTERGRSAVNPLWKDCGLFLQAHVCMQLCQEHDWILTHEQFYSWSRQIFTLKLGWPLVSLISPSLEEHWRAQNSVQKHKQVTLSCSLTLWLYSFNRGCWNCNVICNGLFSNEQPCQVKWAADVTGIEEAHWRDRPVFNLSCVLHNWCKRVEK